MRIFCCVPFLSNLAYAVAPILSRPPQARSDTNGHSISLARRKGVAAAVSDSQHIAQLTRAVFTAAFEPMKKQIESVQRSAQT